MKQDMIVILDKAFGITAKYIYVPLTVIVFILGLVYHGIG